MVEIKAKLKIAKSAYRLEVKGRLRLSFALRKGGHAQARLESGEEVALRLPRGEVLRGGDLVTASDGRVMEVVAAAERLLHAAFASAADLAKAAYRLGGRHEAVEFHLEGLRVAADAGNREMLRKMGATLSEVEAPFEPEVEAEAHAGGHHHHHDHGHEHHDQDHHPHDHRGHDHKPRKR